MVLNALKKKDTVLWISKLDAFSGQCYYDFLGKMYLALMIVITSNFWGVLQSISQDTEKLTVGLKIS